MAIQVAKMLALCTMEVEYIAPTEAGKEIV